MSIAVAIGAYSITHAPQPWETRAEAMAARSVLLGELNTYESSEHLVDVGVANELVDMENHLDTIDDDLGRLEKAQGLRPHRYHRHKSR